MVRPDDKLIAPPFVRVHQVHKKEKNLFHENDHVCILWSKNLAFFPQTLRMTRGDFFYFGLFLKFVNCI